MSYLPYDPDLGYAPEADDPMGLGNLAARQRAQTGRADNPADREEAKCRRCGSGECAVCAVPVRPSPGNVPPQVCHVCRETLYGVTAHEIDLTTGANAPIVPPCGRGSRRSAA